MYIKMDMVSSSSYCVRNNNKKGFLAIWGVERLRRRTRFFFLFKCLKKRLKKKGQKKNFCICILHFLVFISHDRNWCIQQMCVCVGVVHSACAGVSFFFKFLHAEIRKELYIKTNISMNYYCTKI